MVPHLAAQERRSLGAFHPKILLLVTRSRLVVVVSTANLVSQMTADMSWVQAFPRRWRQGQEEHDGDFGRVLTDLLERIDESLGGQAQQARRAGEEAAAAGTEANGPLAFLRRHLGSADLDAMVSKAPLPPRRRPSARSVSSHAKRPSSP